MIGVRKNKDSDRMLKKKITYSQEFLKKYEQYFCCLNCQEKMSFKEPQSLVCVNGHRYDLSKKGTIHFPNHHMSSDYDQEMLTHRRAMILAGLYQPVLDVLKEKVAFSDYESIVEMGCGEGSFLNQLILETEFKGFTSGFDLSKDGVQMASDYNAQAFWFLGDVTQVPLEDAKLDLVLNMLSPVSYEEVKRVLKPTGQIIKIIPESDYLKELRMLFFKDEPEKLTYSNEHTDLKFKENLTLISEERVTYKIKVTPENYEHILKMSPLHWGASQEARLYAQQHPFSELTIDLKILIGQK